MAVYPSFGVKTLLLLVIPAAIAAAVLAAASGRGVNVFKKQGTAWAITIVMVLAAVGIGYARAPGYNHPDPEPILPSQTAPPAAASSFVWDNARVLSSRTVRELDGRNRDLWEDCRVTIGVVTCDYGGDDLGGYAMQCAGDMGLGGYDMIVALDISGGNYWLIQGDDLRRDFTDGDCSDYAYQYMERPFAKGDYDRAVLQLTEALEDWYDDYFD